MIKFDRPVGSGTGLFKRFGDFLLECFCANGRVK